MLVVREEVKNVKNICIKKRKIYYARIKKKITLKNSQFPKMAGELLHSNQFLKAFAFLALVLVFIGLGIILVMAMKEPMIITLGPDGKSLERTIQPKAEDQIREGIKRYLEKRYQWEPGNVVKKLKESEKFITPQALKAFQVAVTNVAKFSMDKIVSQKVYPEKIEIDLKKQTALITGDQAQTEAHPDPRVQQFIHGRLQGPLNFEG